MLTSFRDYETHISMLVKLVVNLATVLAVAVVVSVLCAVPALAVNVIVWGGQTQLEQETPQGETMAIDVLNLQWEATDTVFISVRDGESYLMQLAPYALGNAVGDSPDSVGTFSLDVPRDTLEQKLKNGSYEVQAYAKHSTSSLLYEGKVYGVWAALQPSTTDGGGTPEPTEPKRLIIGTRTVGAGVPASFEAPQVLYDGGKAYKLVGGPTGEGALEFSYEEFDSSSSVDGVIKYVDKDGTVLKSESIPDIPANGEVTREIPSAIIVDGRVYRTMLFQSSVTAQNPGRTSFMVPCTLMSDEQAAASGHYLAIIRMVDEQGDVVAVDSVNVRGEFTYTAPTYIYKTHMLDDSKSQVVTYTIVNSGSAVLHLSAVNDRALVQDGKRVIDIEYQKSTDALETQVTFNLIDGRERVGAASRNLGTKIVTVDKTNPTAVPDDYLSVDGQTFKLAGDPATYAFTYGSGNEPVINVYYVPSDYVPPGPYQLSINYVNYANNQVITTEVATSSPDDLADLLIAPPATFVEGGVTYVRLAGQDEPISHNYYSSIRTYTVYYRDVNDTLGSDAVVEKVRVVYEDGPTTTTVVNVGSAAGAAGAAGTAGTAGANGAGVQTGRLNQNGTYTQMGGDGNGTLTNESGTDSNTERIQETETPTSSGTGQETAGLPPWAIPASIIALVAVVALIALFVALAVRRRTDDGKHARKM